MILHWICLVLAALPCGLFLLNLFAYRRLPSVSGTTQISVLIPARDEEANIGATVEAVLKNQDLVYEIIVLDDNSSDRTSEIVQRIVARDPRVRIEAAPPLPRGWCGKQHACHALAQLAQYPLLLFLDADVRLAPDALGRLSAFLEKTDAALASGVPGQELGTISERVLLPLIHFVLLAFLPMHAMRRTRWPAMSAGCGQLFIARRDAYQLSGGHSSIRASLHDGITLPRTFRRAGFKTDLFDATDIARCRMYRTDRETWRGLSKNATEALASPALILQSSILLFGGQVLPFVLLAFTPSWLSAVGVLLSLLPRAIGAIKFHQPLLGVVLHPLGVAGLLGIQWAALFRYALGRPAEWKGRTYEAITP